MVSRRGISGAGIVALLLFGAPLDSRAQPAASSPIGSAQPVAIPSAQATAQDWIVAEWPDAKVPASVQEATELELKRTNLVAAQRWEEVTPIVERLVRWVARVRGADDMMTLERVMWLAHAEQRTGAWAAAERHLRMVLAAIERTHREGYVRYRYARDALVDLYVEKGDFGRAEPIARALVDEAERETPDTTTVAVALRSLASVRRAQGAFDEAEALLVRALGIVRAHGEPAQMSFVDRGDGAPSDEDFAQSKTRVEESPILGDLAAISLDLRKLDAAERYARARLAAAEETNGPASMSAAIVRHDLGRVLVERGRGAEAWAEYARSLAIREALNGESHPSLATALHSMTRLRLAQGDGPEAEALARRALPLVEAMNGPDHRRTADVLEDLAEALVIQGRAREAIPIQERAATIRDRDAQAVLAVGSDAQRRLLVARLRKQRDATLTIVTAAGASGASLGLRTALRDKGRLADASSSEMAALRSRLNEADRAVFDELAQVTAAISSAAARGETAALGAEVKERLDRLETQRQTLSARIADRSAAFKADASLVTVDDVARRLPDDAALVEIVQYRPFLLRSAPSEASTMTPWGAPRYAAYVLRRGEVTPIDLGLVTDVDRAVTTFRRALTANDLTRDPKPAARAAYEAIFAKIDAALGGASHVLWSPDGALQLVPVAALVDGSGRYLAERLLLTHLTSGRDLVRFDDAPPPKSGPIVIGAPDFGALPGAPSREAERRGVDLRAEPEIEADRPRAAPEIEANRAAERRAAQEIDMRRIGFLPLPGTAREASAVADAISAKAVLTGDQATESAVKWAHAPSVLHIATHGFFLPSAVSDVSPDLDLTGSEAAVALAADSPLVRSGLAFAGANQRASGTEDGILTGLEASGLDLFGTELVVLSACETGLGVATPGDGVHGLRRAFAIAGAETLVMSLWEVDSGRTRELMTAYYEALATGAGRSEAMRRTQLTMLANKDASHPFYWASFIVSGRWAKLREASLSGLRRVDPGPRGCTCALPEETSAPGRSASAIMGIAIAASYIRRVTRRRTSR